MGEHRDPVGVGKTEIQEDHVGVHRLHGPQALGGRRRLGNLPAGGLEHQAGGKAEDFTVLDYQYSRLGPDRGLDG